MCPYIGELASINDICEITSRKKIKIEGFRLLGFYSTPSPSRTLFLLPLSSNLSAFTGNQEDTPSIFFLLRASIFLRRSSLIESLSPPSSQAVKYFNTASDLILITIDDLPEYLCSCHKRGWRGRPGCSEPSRTNVLSVCSIIPTDFRVFGLDKNTGSARGFGFVLFSDPSVADKVLQDKHVILGRTVEVKKAVPRGDQHQHQHQHQHHHPHQQQNKGSSRNSSNGGTDNQFRTKKIFVGGLSSSLTEEEFKSYFEKFGRITDVVVMYDSVTHRPRGFGFITFDSEEAVESVMQKNFHELNEKFVEVKRAVPKDGNSNGTSNGTNTRVRGERGSLCGTYRGPVNPPYSPSYWMFPSYTHPPLPGYGSIGGYPYGATTYGGGYSFGGYGGIGYGTHPIAVPRSPWYGPSMVGARRSPVLYGDTAIYPGYMNGGVGGVLGMAAGGHRGMRPAVNGKWNRGNGSDAQVPASTMPHQNDGEKLEDDPAGFSESYGAGAGKQNQRGPDGRFGSCPVINSS
ncbi:hypothetical protein NE237_017235 [Protea cynaroides]|uniref:RRM domain-containing protein n=1 Tax=Protea cynaroides TaxID=273540 RepID=A0A9Q0K7Q1_9MAGN|nr:hypothetical protein NE237_017235 [Protea cynaroides]